VIVKLYSIRDELVGFGKPFALPSDEVAVREYKKAVKADSPNDVNTNIPDSVLFCLATFDDQSGEIVPAKAQLLRASEVE
jgi:hypothetical protein